MAISIDGSNYSFIRHPLSVEDVDSKNYSGMVVKECKKKSRQNCFLFANGYKIVWNNGTHKSERRLKRRDIKDGRTIDILKQLGFYDGDISKTKKIKKKKIKKKNKSKC